MRLATRSRWGHIAAATVAALALAAGPVTAVPAAARAKPGKRSDAVRVLSWNIWLGGKAGEVGGAENLPRVIDQLVDIAPDVFLAVETYGSAGEIRDGLTERAGKGEYSATRITSNSSDNLWIFTRYPVTKTYPKPTGSVVSDFNFGGIRVRLPGGRELNLFDTWLSYTNPWIGDMIDTNAHDVKAGKQPTYSPAEVEAGEESQQIPQITDIVDKQLPYMLGGNTDPVVLAGDLNTLPAADWSSDWAGCESHYGLDYSLGATKKLTGAGFSDSYRAAQADACKSPGRTWSPYSGYDYMITSDRIDFIFTRGAGVNVTGSQVVDERLPQHGDGEFYSDHGAVITDLKIS